MLKKTITYTDYDGNERTEDFYFNLNQTELMELQFSESGGLQNYIHKAISTQEMGKLMEIFKEIILKSYGEKSLDGRRFVKSPEITANFTQTEAYNKLFITMATNDKEASDFINGIMPAEMIAQVEKQKKEMEANGSAPAAIPAKTEA